MAGKESPAEPVDVSVIVPAHNAQATIGATLAALGRQEFAGSYEVIVVDDGSSDRTAEIARQAGARVIRRPTAGGPAGARNAGREAAAGTVLAFTDADCEPTPRWLAEGWSATRDADLVQGAISPIPGVPVGPFDRTLRVDESSPRLFESANVFVRPDLFDVLGGFSPFAQGEPGNGQPPGLRPDRPIAFGEDIVFGWAAQRQGARVRFHAAALVHHAVFPRGPRGYVRERWRLRWMPALVREVPEMRTNFVGGVFLSRRSARFDLALAAVAVAGGSRTRWPLLLALPYLSTLRRTELWRRSAWRENLGLACGDAMGFAALVRGSAAARTVVL